MSAPKSINPVELFTSEPVLLSYRLNAIEYDVCRTVENKQKSLSKNLCRTTLADSILTHVAYAGIRADCLLSAIFANARFFEMPPKKVLRYRPAKPKGPDRRVNRE